MTFHEKIQRLRKQKKWSQAELGEKIGVHVTHISRLENGKFMPSMDLLLKLAEIFEVTTDYLLYDNIDNNGPINLTDKTLYEKMKLVDNLDEKDRIIIMGVIDAFLTKRQMWEVLNRGTTDKS